MGGEGRGRDGGSAGTARRQPKGEAIVRATTLYRIRYHEEDTPSGVTTEWFTTFTKAAKRLRRLGLGDECKIWPVEVQRTRTGLVEFLNVEARIG